MGRALTDEARSWRKQAALIARSAMRRSGLSDPIFRRPFSVDVWFTWRDKRSQIDADGALKLVLDAMNGIVYSSDKFCLPRCLGIAHDEKNPRIDLVVSCPPTNLVEMVE